MISKLIGHKLTTSLIALGCVFSLSLAVPWQEAYAASSNNNTSVKSQKASTKAASKASAKTSAKSSAKTSAKSGAKASAKKSTASKSTKAKKSTAKTSKSSNSSNSSKSAKSSKAVKAAAAAAAVGAAGAALANQYVESKVDPYMITSYAKEMDRINADLSLDSFNKMPKSRISKMREAYVQAENAFKRGDEALGFKIQKEQLEGYPLNIWLTYFYLGYNIRPEKFEAALAFIQSNKQSELSSLLKDRYAAYLSDERDYERLARLIGPKPFDESKLTTLTFNQKAQMCRFYEANWPLNKVNEDAITFATRVYLDLTKRPLSCNALISLFDAKGYLTDKLMLKRYENAYVLRYYQDTTNSLAKQLERTSFGDRVKVQMELYEDPGTLFEKITDNDEQAHRAAVLAFKRFANLSPLEARNNFDKFIKTYAPSEAELVDIYQIFASSFLGRAFSLEDVLWVDKNLPAVAWSTQLKEQRLRRAIYFAQWDNVYILIDHLPQDLQKNINWRYWKGRAAYELGKTNEALGILEDVAKDRSFFGFYAAQALGVEYALNYVKIDPNFSFPMDIANNQAAIRFLELYALDDDDAIYEWREIAKRSPEHEAMLMAQWALQTGNVRYAIDFVVSSQKWDALDYRFPIAYKELFEQYAQESQVPLSFLYGISRQESMLNHKIKSWAGALGLMQVMPETARDIAKKEKWKFEGNASLTDPQTNIQYGSTYLKWMLEKFDNNRVLAAAAYNAGPGRIPQWKSNDGIYRDAAMYIECIPFEETRKYVQNVLLYDAIYNFLITGKKGELMRKSELSYIY